MSLANYSLRICFYKLKFFFTDFNFQNPFLTTKKNYNSNRLLNRTRDIVNDIKENSEYDPGFIENGGIFIARNQVFVLKGTKLVVRIVISLF